MDRDRVAAFYRGKGYQVHQGIVVTGQSGNQQRVPMLCEGPWGNLAVFFGDSAGIDGPEIGSAKRVARDLGATAVVAAPHVTPEHRMHAAELGVVLLDEEDIAKPEAPAPPLPGKKWPGATPAAALDEAMSAHPWPASGRIGGEAATPGTVAYDIDEVASATSAPQPSETMPVPSPAPTLTRSSPDVVQSTRRSNDGGLWRSSAGIPSVRSTDPASTPSASPIRGGTKFAWLGRGQAVAEAEATVASRPAAPVAAPAARAESTPAPRHPARAHDDLLRQARMRVWMRRGAWLLGGAGGLYLFLLWWT